MRREMRRRMRRGARVAMPTIFFQSRGGRGLPENGAMQVFMAISHQQSKTACVYIDLRDFCQHSFEICKCVSLSYFHISFSCTVYLSKLQQAHFRIIKSSTAPSNKNLFSSPPHPKLMRPAGRISHFLNKIEYCKPQIGVYFTKSLLISSSIVFEICSLA